MDIIARVNDEESLSIRVISYHLSVPPSPPHLGLYIITFHC